MIKKQSIDSVPFAKNLGVEALSVDRRCGSTRLRECPETLNHVGSFHAAALFAVGEAASGLTMAGVMAPVITALRPVASHATIAYLKIANGVITARGMVEGEPDDLVELLKSNGKLRMPVSVELQNEAGETVATMVVEWHLRLKS